MTGEGPGSEGRLAIIFGDVEFQGVDGALEFGPARLAHLHGDVDEVEEVGEACEDGLGWLGNGSW